MKSVLRNVKQVRSRLSDTHVVLQETEVLSTKRAVGQRRHLAQVKRRQPDPGPFSANNQSVISKINKSIF